MFYSDQFDVIVIGGGHAGTEAAMAASRMGADTLLISHNIETLGQMSCNPAIGGIGKGHLVKEIDALGGLMAKAIDLSGIQFRRLNSSKGPAVRATRAQADRILFKAAIRYALENQPNLKLFQQAVTDLLIENGQLVGIVTEMGLKFRAKSIVLTTGTFLGGLIHIGLEQVQYMESILSDLLSFSRPDQLNLEWLAIDKLMDTTLIGTQKLAEENKVVIKTHYQTGLPTLYIDKTKMRQVFSNLIINAIQACNIKDDFNLQYAEIIISILLKITELGTTLEVTIKDNGIGINADIQQKLFEPFFTTRAQGTGLGLAIVKRIIEQHSGNIIISSEHLKETQVIISLPISLENTE